MNLIICQNYDEMSDKAAEILKEQLMNKPDTVLGLATGSSPIGTYERLGNMCKNGELDFSKVTTFNLDEYFPICSSNDQSYHYFMNENFFKHINVKPENTHILNGETDNPTLECARFEDEIEKSGGMDILILGIGRNGHIGFNEPDSTLYASTHMTSLTADTIEANSRFFERADLVPTHALTMGMSTILKAKKILLLANGRSKLEAIKKLLSDDITTNTPATMLKLHPDVTIICDYDAYADVRIGIDIGGMSAKVGVVNNHKIIARKDIPITPESTTASITEDLYNACDEFRKTYHTLSVGIGTPGLIKNDKITASNLPFKDFALGDILSKKLHVQVKIANDANCAALGEQVAGAGKGSKDMILITLGTGIGGGIILDGRIFSGNGSAGEIGHMCIETNGLPCPCGGEGCWEQYASVTALMRQTREAIEKNPDSILADCGKEKVSGRTVFAAIEKGCPVAEQVLDTYLDYLAAGITGLLRIFDITTILISGGLSNAGDALLIPLKEKIKLPCELKVATLKNDAGIIGAAAL